MTLNSDKPVRHLLGLSGGKDSAALAIYMRDKVPDMEYFFADTGAELPETLEFVDLMEDYLGKKIIRLNAGRDFDYYLKLNGNFLPTARSRWCTVNLKLKPFEQFVGDEQVITYVALRADEPYRTGYISTKPNISAVYPFKEDGKIKEDIIRILEESGVGIPKYYNWRSRSGCYFCFYQRKVEWIGLYENHPDLFKKAKEFEDYHRNLGRNHSWSQDEYLEEMITRMDEIKDKFNLNNQNTKPKNFMDVVIEVDDEDSDDGCLVCFK